MNIKLILVLMLSLCIFSACKDSQEDKSLKTTAIVSPEKNSIKETEKNKDVKVVTDMDEWKHPVKQVLGVSPYNIYKLELERNSTYPKFYIKYPDRNALNDVKAMETFIYRIAELNAFWDFELINEKNNITIKVVCDKTVKRVTKVSVNGNPYGFNSGKRQKGSKIEVPEKFEKYLKNKSDPGNEDVITFFKEEDLDNDKSNEIIIGSGTGEEDVNGSYMPQLYILRERNGKIEELGENLATGGYAVYGAKLIRLQGETKKFLHCELSNGANLHGFKIIELIGNKTNVICYSASATGAGNDWLMDYNNDGQFDGYVQERWSYDVLYYPVVRKYEYKNNNFSLISTTVSIPEYPTTVKETIMQYISLKTLNEEESFRIKLRLAELCEDEKTNKKVFAADEWHQLVLNTLLGSGEMIKFDIKEESDKAKVSLEFNSESGKVNKHVVLLNKQKGKWRIVEFS